MSLLPLALLVRNRPELPVHQVGDCVRRALVLAEIKHGTAAYQMGISEAELSRQLNERGPNLARLMVLGPVFLGHFLAALGNLAEVDITTERRQASRELAVLRAELADLRARIDTLSADRRSA